MFLEIKYAINPSAQTPWISKNNAKLFNNSACQSMLPRNVLIDTIVDIDVPESNNNEKFKNLDIENAIDPDVNTSIFYENCALKVNKSQSKLSTRLRKQQLFSRFGNNVMLVHCTKMATSLILRFIDQSLFWKIFQKVLSAVN